MRNQIRKIAPVVLSGGAGTRLWPLSRSAYPKQLLSLFGDESLIQQTVRRVSGRIDDDASFSAPIVVCNQEHRFLIAEQLRNAGIDPDAIILEPAGRNSAPAAAIAAMTLAQADPEALMLLTPADHVIRDVPAFLDAVATGIPAAADGRLVTFGIHPSHPETGYGYIRAGSVAEGNAGGTGLQGAGDAGGKADASGRAFHVASFTEKPDIETATGFLASGDYYWNSGIFLFRADTFLGELGRFEPEILAACRTAIAQAHSDLDFTRLGEGFARSPGVSIDYAVMERTDKAVVVPVDPGWSDVGSWSSLWDLGDKDGDGNVLDGDVLSQDSRNNFVKSPQILTALVGVDDLVVVVTDDAVLVASRDRVQDVKKIVEGLNRQGRPEGSVSHRVYRPWGFYQSVHRGERFQVKRITVTPGAQLSLQKHYHRAEHWVVVNGTAMVTRDDEKIMVRENESIYLPLGCTHRLENPGKVPLNLIEVQSGAYLGEDDIVRFDDQYGRTD
ncbi:mannose-1-phosphate guanylyltransferase/mannose-6-phosphate isomerase [Fodinicurvata sp. EGI_FJ10296]|uniref:mannose-1-phosphate guanylyltransferase/mannose-6-phosphate isomerase n=1 Tax=Fodinicurvata sp. EGI_FJ10296 TaxID=3231908 RepID=UPI00345219DF